MSEVFVKNFPVLFSLLSRVYLACDVWFKIRDQTIVLKNIFIKREERQEEI